MTRISDARAELRSHLRERRIALGISQRKFAQLTGNASQDVCACEKGRSALGLNRMIKWADLLGLELVLREKGAAKEHSLTDAGSGERAA